MTWTTEPDRFFRFKQAEFLSSDEHGVCYGMCRKLLELDGRQLKSAESAKRAWEIVGTRLGTNKWMNHAGGAQATRRQHSRDQAAWPLNENTLYIVGCNISLENGYLTHYALWNYLSYSSWRANHAVLLIGVKGGTVVFDPNWGCAAWENMSIDTLTWSAIEELVAGGYTRSRPVYVTEIET